MNRTNTRRTPLLACIAGMVLAGCAAMPTAPSRDQLAREVEQTERAFARTMAERDHAAFTAFLAEEAVFDSGKTVLRGRTQVADAWKRFYTDAQAPFSWEPQRVEVLDSGTLAMSSGPVRDPDGKIVGTFRSI